MIGKEKKVKQWLSRMKLAHKMVLGFLGLIALPFTLLSVFSFASVASHYEHQLAQDGQYMLNMVVSDVNEKMDHVEMLMQVLSCNQNLIAFLSHDYNGAVSHEEYTQTVMPLLQGASNAVSPPLERVYLLTKNTTIPEGYSAVYHYDSIPKSIPTELLENGREATWYHAEIDGKDVLYYLCPIVSSVYKNQGYLLAKMRVDELFPEFGMPQQNGVALFLLDEENRPKLSNVTLNSDFRFPQTAGSQESVRYFSTEIQRVSLRVGVALPVSEHGYLQQSSLLILIFVGFLSLLFLSLFFSMIRSINSRLQRYGDEMERIAESGFNGELAVERQDEIGVIGNQFNRVLGRMRVLMQENIQKETAYKDAQLKALLLQINPHFIYNTLDMFAGKLTLDGEFETADYICDFAQMIRYNTMTSTELPLEKELEHVINYVNLEKCRYGDSVELRIHVPEELRQIIIPRFLLQPIVENSFEHGFTGMAPEEKRQIIITARKMGDRMIIRVRDNGRGMSLKQVEEMNSPRLQDYVANVKQRMDASGMKEEAVERAAAAKLAIQDLMEEKHCAAGAMECWSAVTVLGAPVCMALGELSDEGLPVSCETDVNGAVTMAMLQAVTLGKEACFLADLTIRHPQNDNAELLWHCGPFPYSLKDSSSVARLVQGQERFELKKGPITVCRFDDMDGKYYLFGGEGKGVDGPETNGTYVWFETNNWKMWEEKLMFGPYIHHVGGIYGNYKKVLREAARYLGMIFDDADEQGVYSL